MIQRPLARIILLACLSWFGCSGEDVSVSNSADDRYWTTPTEEAYMLYFEISSNLRADLAAVGKIQYRLDRARTIDRELYDVTKFPDWELGTLLVDVTPDLFAKFDSVSCRFNYKPLDEFLDRYPPLTIEKRFSYFVFHFTIDYNMPVLANYLSKISGVMYATANGIGTFPEVCLRDIHLVIAEELYRFYFVRGGLECFLERVDQHSWLILDMDDHVTLISKKSL